jgi:choline dehydrogenase-like flavoprotein
MGNYGWSWKEVLPYFRRSERSTLRNLKNSTYHGENGPLSVAYNQHRTVLVKAFVESAKFLGQKEVDYNSGQQLGVSYLQGNTLRGRRHSAYKAFLEPILDRSNLHIMINTRVTKILIDPVTKITYGVELVRNRKRYRMVARKEVILSAGTFSSPQLLIVSGVGPKSDLESIDVPLIKDLPVGKIMYDHLSLIGPTFIVNTTGESINSDRAVRPDNVIKYLHGRGLLTVPGGVSYALQHILLKYKYF